jgi:hypothetical protein
VPGNSPLSARVAQAPWPGLTWTPTSPLGGKGARPPPRVAEIATPRAARRPNAILTPIETA